VEREQLSGTFDRELDAEPRRSRGRVVELSPLDQRLLANPALTLATWGAAVVLIRAALRAQHFLGFLTGAALLFLAFFLLQFHCLDCGRTGWLLRYRRHACPAVQARGRTRGLRRRWRGPGLMTQLVLWCHLLAAALFVCLVLLGSQR
jgi:hypothetical protein